jgi:hypothetical protein
MCYRIDAIIQKMEEEEEVASKERELVMSEVSDAKCRKKIQR